MTDPLRDRLLVILTDHWNDHLFRLLNRIQRDGLELSPSQALYLVETVRKDAPPHEHLADKILDAVCEPRLPEPPLRNFWVSWHHVEDMPAFELHTPWWVSGEGSGYVTICAAVRATNELWAQTLIVESYEGDIEDVEWRFVERRPDDWTPFCERFPRADWMQWEGIAP